MADERMEVHLQTLLGRMGDRNRGITKGGQGLQSTPSPPKKIDTHFGLRVHFGTPFEKFFDHGHVALLGRQVQGCQTALKGFSCFIFETLTAKNKKK